MPELESPLEIGGVELPNRLYRAPLLECAGEGPDAADVLADELEPAAAAGAGLVCQGAAPVRESGGRVAPSMTPFADPTFVATLSAVPERIHAHGGRIFAQLDAGGLRSMETWHAAYRRANPDLRQLAVSRPPWPFRAADRLGVLELDARASSRPTKRTTSRRTSGASGVCRTPEVLAERGELVREGAYDGDSGTND